MQLLPSPLRWRRGGQNTYLHPRCRSLYICCTWNSPRAWQIPFSSAFLKQLSLKHSTGHRRNQRGDTDACHNIIPPQTTDCKVRIPLIMYLCTQRMAPGRLPKPFSLQWCFLLRLGWEMGVGYRQTLYWTSVFISGFWMKVSEDNKKKELVQVIISTGTIFIFNFMSQCETVWQIEIIMYIVNCFNVINSAFTELILIMWGCHLAITKYFRMQTMNMFSYIYIYIF